MATVTEKLLTAEEYAQMPDLGYRTELYRGKVIKMPPPGSRHGQICSKIVRVLGNYVDNSDLGHILCNDSGVITERDPDSVRGADVSFFSFARLPKGPLPDDYPSVAPELVFEVLSPNDRWQKVLVKIAEYLSIGVSIVCIVEPRTSKIYLYRSEEPLEVLGSDDVWTVPEVLPGFSIPVRQFFE